jgi:hypothetical protein
MLLSFGAGLLVGTSWTVRVIDERCRRLAAQRRELNEWRRALQESAWRQRTATGSHNPSRGSCRR